MAPSRKLLASLLLASTILAGPALAQVPEAPGAEPAAPEPLTPPQAQTPATEDAAPAAPDDPAPDDAAPPADEAADIVVTGRFIPNEKRETAAIVAVLGKTELQRTGDDNISGALTRVTGLSLVNGRFVYVRGLGGRYSSALLDGSALPSPEPLNRVVPLDVFPTDLLEGALIQKTYSVEYPGEFAGGTISLRTLAVPDKNFFEIGVSGGYNDESTFERGLSYKGGAFDYVGIGDEQFELPTAISTNPSLNGFDAGQLQVAGRSLIVRRGPGFSIDREDNLPDLEVNATLGRRFDVAGMSAGLVLAFSFNNETRNEFGVRNRYLNPQGDLLVNFDPAACVGSSVDQSTCGRFQTDQEITVGALASLGVEIDDENKVKATTVLLRKTNKLAEIQRGRTPFASGNAVVSDQQLAFVEQELWFNQLSGEHKIGLSGLFTDLTFAWRGNYSRASRTSPFRTEYSYDYDEVTDRFRLSGSSNDAAINFSALTDDNYEGGGDFTLSGDGIGIPTVLKFGGIYNKKDRAYSSRRYSFDFPNGQLGALAFFVPEIIFSPDNIGPGGLQLSIPTARSQANAFVASTEIYGGYGSLELQVTEQVRLIGGVRWEKSKQFVNGFTGDPADLLNQTRCVQNGALVEGFVIPIACTLNADYFLPAASLTYEFADNMQVRFGYSKTLSRPDLRELSPAVIYNEQDDLDEQGDPTLRITRIDNYDARYEWYFGNKQLFSLGGFYKKLTNPIERSISSFGDGGRRIFINGDKGEVYGGEVELELTVPLDEWIDDPFLADRRFFVIGNFTYSKSKVTIDPARQGILTNLSRRLEGQSEILGNAQVGYERKGERMAFLFNYAGDRISDVGSFGLPDVIEEPPITYDFTFAKAFPVGDSEIEVGFKISNIANDRVKRTQGGLIYETNPIGRTFSLGIKARM